MASYTKNLNLIKPVDTDLFTVEHANSNMQKIDDAYGKVVTLTGTTAPTTSTVGIIGQFYLNTSTKLLYQCMAVSGSTYTWQTVVSDFLRNQYLGFKFVSKADMFFGSGTAIPSSGASVAATFCMVTPDKTKIVVGISGTAWVYNLSTHQLICTGSISGQIIVVDNDYFLTTTAPVVATSSTACSVYAYQFSSGSIVLKTSITQTAYSNLYYSFDPSQNGQPVYNAYHDSSYLACSLVEYNSDTGKSDACIFFYNKAGNVLSSTVVAVNSTNVVPFVNVPNGILVYARTNQSSDSTYTFQLLAVFVGYVSKSAVTTIYSDSGHNGLRGFIAAATSDGFAIFNQTNLTSLSKYITTSGSAVLDYTVTVPSVYDTYISMDCVDDLLYYRTGSNSLGKYDLKAKSVLVATDFEKGIPAFSSSSSVIMGSSIGTYCALTELGIAVLNGALSNGTSVIVKTFPECFVYVTGV